MLMSSEDLFDRDTELEESLPQVDEDWKQMKDVIDYYRKGQRDLALALLRQGYGIHGPVDELIKQITIRNLDATNYDLINFLISSRMIERASLRQRVDLWGEMYMAIPVNVALARQIYPLYPDDAEFIPNLPITDVQAQELIKRFILLSQTGPEAKRQVERGLANQYVTAVCNPSQSTPGRSYLKAIDNVYIPILNAALSSPDTDSSDGDVMTIDQVRLIEASMEYKLSDAMRRSKFPRSPEEKASAIAEIEDLVSQGIGRCYGERGLSPAIGKLLSESLQSYYLGPHADTKMEGENDGQLHPSAYLAAVQLDNLSDSKSVSHAGDVKRVIDGFNPTTDRGKKLYDQLLKQCADEHAGRTSQICSYFSLRFPEQFAKERADREQQELEDIIRYAFDG